MKKIKLRLIDKKTGELFEEGWLDIKIYKRMLIEKNKSRLSWENYIKKLLKIKPKG